MGTIVSLQTALDQEETAADMVLKVCQIYAKSKTIQRRRPLAARFIRAIKTMTHWP